MIYSLLAVKTIRLRDGVWRPGELMHTPSLPLAVSLTEAGSAEPNNAATAEACELALRLRHLGSSTA